MTEAPSPKPSPVITLGDEAGFVVHRWARIQSADLDLVRIVARVDENDVVTRVEVG